MKTLSKRICAPAPIALLVYCSLLSLASNGQEPAAAYTSPLHTFSMDDLLIDFEGRTVAQDPAAICGLPGGISCPGEIDPATGQPYVYPIVDKQNITLYPVDTEFGFEVVDFLGAEGKSLASRDYAEGYVGNITEGDKVIGVKVSNAKTDTYKVKPPLGTWCQGLGGTSVKCSTEHYTVLEHALTCHETVPYLHADPETGNQGVLMLPSGEQSQCALAGLDDQQVIVGEQTPLTAFSQLAPNDNLRVDRDIAVSSDYSITVKDDGKALYRWGGLIKRPNDIRLYARIPLPSEWKEPGAEYEIRSAKLVVTHWITNNPNDQLRPEDLENEAATGRKPAYWVDANDNWRSAKDCFEGDGDFIEENTYFRHKPDSTLIPAGDSPPLETRLSKDLSEGYTNAYYTSIDRDPFQWSYVNAAEAAAGRFHFLGFEHPLKAEETVQQGLVLVSGPRWRLRANKFGQDIPGLEIPRSECTVPPYTHDNIRYEVGTPVTTVINLLDWDAENGASPLASSRGWVDVANNLGVEVQQGVVSIQNGIEYPVSTNGLPMTEDFDLAVYIKGDRKPTALFTAQLLINQEMSEQPLADAMSIYRLKTPNKVRIYKDDVRIAVTVLNEETAMSPGDGELVIVATREESGEVVAQFTTSIDGLEPGRKKTYDFLWTSPGEPGLIIWTASVLKEDKVIAELSDVTLVRSKGQ
ncbi:hypothetical protein [Ferrimonas futtsuensis]|uniref:hypothetical protein n=1 Tax=Ferrimonas futtsuensis TaxID=364764 RepID=UPI0012F7081D|nr:hypothetical protein [Ferrimonas futtsuensis]